MTVRSLIIAELFRRCADERPTIEWVAGYPGDNPPREMVWVFEVEGEITVPTFPMRQLDDTFLVTLHAHSSTAGQSRAEAMANAEGYLSTVEAVILAAPALGGTVDPALATTFGTKSGPYSEPNSVEPGGFRGICALDIRFESRPTAALTS